MVKHLGGFSHPLTPLEQQLYFLDGHFRDQVHSHDKVEEGDKVMFADPQLIYTHSSGVGFSVAIGKLLQTSYLPILAWNHFLVSHAASQSNYMTLFVASK